MEYNSELGGNNGKQLTPLQQIKKNIVKANWSYLCNHPEVRAIIRVLLQNAINDKPKNVFNYAADLFDCNKTPLVLEMINKELMCVKDLLKKGHWTEYDGEMMFTLSLSTPKAESEASTSIDSILSLSMLSESSDQCGDI